MVTVETGKMLSVHTVLKLYIKGNSRNRQNVVSAYSAEIIHENYTPKFNIKKYIQIRLKIKYAFGSL